MIGWWDTFFADFAINMGMTFPNAALFIMGLGTIIIGAKDFKIATAFLLMFSSVILMLCVKRDWSIVNTIIVMFLSVIMLSLILFFSQSKSGGII